MHVDGFVALGLKNIKMAVQMYYQENLQWPQKLDHLVPYFFAKLPDPVDGKWLYNSDNGEIRHRVLGDAL